MKKITLTLVITFMSIAFYSCQKSDTEFTKTESPQTSEAKKDRFTRKSSISIATINTEAQAHNDCLDHIASQSGFPNITCSQLATIVHNYFGATPSSQLQHHQNYCQAGYSSDYEQDAIDRYNQQLITLEYKDRLIELIDYFDNYSNLSAFESALTTYQINVNQNNTLSSSEKERLITTAAVGMKSMQYWSDVVNDNQHDWNDIANPDNQPPSYIVFAIWAIVDALETEKFFSVTHDRELATRLGTQASADRLLGLTESNGGSSGQ